ncbi:hypothetical protein [Nocardioides sp.]|uniref:hypothetical protein n=1 Tax=Nocardioides sp. TaxID=35761 RepID=UPI002D8041E3|nr:hypothetical protein [Nocardioides sp.]HET8960749.1 hypothetical protein [Nocardioides sp.]
MSTRHTYPAVIGSAVLLGSVIAAAPAQAGGGDFTERTGSCSANASWVMKAKHDTGRIEMEFSVETQRAGQRWTVRVRDNGALVFSGARRTNRISRSLSVDRMLTNRAGTDRFVARAINARTGEVCRGRVALAPAGSSGSSG